LGSFSFGSWCHFVGTGGGTDIDDGSGLASRLTSEGFSLHTADAIELFEDFGDGSSSVFPDALRFSLDRLFVGVIVVVVAAAAALETVVSVGVGVGETGFVEAVSSGRRTLGTLSVCWKKKRNTRVSFTRKLI
jgi:hypothetical protein